VKLEGREWLLHTVNPVKKIEINFKKDAKGRYEMAWNAGRYAGFYELQGDKLVNVEPAQMGGVPGMVWEIKGPERLELVTTDYRGATIVPNAAFEQMMRGSN
jgi:hypothetical protein